MGHSRKEMLTRADRDLFPEEEARACCVSDDEVFATSRESEYEKELTTPAGSVRLLKVRKRLIRAPGPNGAEPFLLVSLQDITESRRDEMALQENEARFRSLADGAPVIIWMGDASGGTFVNKAWLELTGRRTKDMEPPVWRPKPLRTLNELMLKRRDTREPRNRSLTMQPSIPLDKLPLHSQVLA